MLTAFLNGVIYTGMEKIAEKVLLTGEGRIQGITEPGMVPAEAEKIDCHNGIIAPGLVDLQIYGGGGYLFSDQPSSAALTSMADSLLKTGTTGFCLTLATNSAEVFRKAIRVVRENPHPAVLGLHFEGPYINPVKRGAHLEQYIRRPEKKEIEQLLKEGDGVLKMMTLAPEMCDPEIIRMIADHGVVVSAGHSNASFGQAAAGFRNGVTATTHLFNAMSPLHHRDTGLPGATFLTPSIMASIIADGIHVDFNALRISKEIMKERLFLITDAVEEVREGAYIHVKQEDRFTLPDGTLSGSRLTLLKAVENCVRHAGIPLDEALRMATVYPSGLMRTNRTGKIEPGYDADLTICSEDFKIKYTVLKGAVVRG